MYFDTVIVIIFIVLVRNTGRSDNGLKYIGRTKDQYRFHSLCWQSSNAKKFVYFAFRGATINIMFCFAHYCNQKVVSISSEMYCYNSSCSLIEKCLLKFPRSRPTFYDIWQELSNPAAGDNAEYDVLGPRWRESPYLGHVLLFLMYFETV